MTQKNYINVYTVEQACSFAKEYSDDFCYIAGGTDIMVNKFQGNVITSNLIDISNIEDLKKVN